MDAKKDIGRDWSSLAPELLNLIARNLSEISDFVRFRAVCTTWRFSTPITDLPQQFPWIFEDRGLPCEQRRLFYSITSHKMYTIHAPKCLGKMFLRSSQGYILTELCGFTDQDSSDYNTYQLSLLNLLNNHEILLPAWDFCLYYYISAIGPWQCQIGEYVVCIEHLGSQGHKLAYCCLGQDNWCEFKSEYNVNIRWFLLKSLLFMLEEDTGVTKVTDLFTGAIAYVIPPVENYMENAVYYHVEASGDIMLVFLRYGSSDDFYDDWFDVYKLDLSEINSPCWVKVNNIGNQALFIDTHGCFALEAGDFAEVRANCIYSIEPNCQIMMTDIESGDLEILEFPFRGRGHWFVPNLQRLQVQ